MKAITIAARERILNLFDQGKGYGAIAASCGYCVAAVCASTSRPEARWRRKPTAADASPS